MDRKRLKKIFGIGPVGALISLVVLIIAYWIDTKLAHPAILSDPLPLKLAGSVSVLFGIYLFFWSFWALRHWWVNDRLCTDGPFRWFRHPMYAAWITFILPGAALFFNSWIMFLFVVSIHPIWHALVIHEEKIMSERFRDEYDIYAKQTGRFCPRIGGKGDR